MTSLVADGMQQLAQAFMAEIASAQIAGGIEDEVSGQVNAAIMQAQQSDPQGRTFVLTFLTLSPEGITFTICPQPGLSPRPVLRAGEPPVRGTSSQA